MKCTAEIQRLLDNHKDETSKISSKEAPAVAMLAEMKEKTKINQVMALLGPDMYSGGLLDTDVAAINNWFHSSYHNAERLIREGLAAYAIAHCRTLLIAHHHHAEFLQNDPSVDYIEQYVLQKSWDRLKDWQGLTVDGRNNTEGVDVNFEALSLLDRIMFDKSEKAGVAGNDQWGLDVGPHELCWGPSFRGPDVTYGKKRDGGDDIELTVCLLL